jgi:hypothetical protein
VSPFYTGVFVGGKVVPRYKQLARLKLSMLHGSRTFNKQNIPGALAAGILPKPTCSNSAWPWR